MTGVDPDALADVAAFDERALAVLTRIGFERIGRYRGATNGRSYDVLALPADRLVGRRLR